MLSIEEFHAAIALYNKRMVVTVAATFLTLFVFLVPVALLRDTFLGSYRRWFGVVAAEILLGLTPAPALVILFGGLWLGERRATRDPRLSCPSCGKSIKEIKHLVIATRNCGHCGKRILAEPESVF